jgi:hypothetical protein
MNRVTSQALIDLSLGFRTPDDKARISSDEADLPQKKWHNLTLRKELFLTFLLENKKTNANYLLLESYASPSLPSLETKSLDKLITLVTEVRKVCGNGGRFEVQFTLAELFNHLYRSGIQKGKKIIHSIELVGSAVPWLLENYSIQALHHLGILEKDNTLAEELLRENFHSPSDLDFRVHIENASEQDILFYRQQIVEFLVQQICPSSHKQKDSYRQLIQKTGFTKFPLPINNRENEYAAIGLHDEISGLGIDLLIIKKLFRLSLFTQDALRLPFLPLLRSIGFCLPPNMKSREQFQTFLYILKL